MEKRKLTRPINTNFGKRHWLEVVYELMFKPMALAGIWTLNRIYWRKNKVKYMPYKLQAFLEEGHKVCKKKWKTFSPATWIYQLFWSTVVAMLINDNAYCDAFEKHLRAYYKRMKKEKVVGYGK